MSFESVPLSSKSSSLTFLLVIMIAPATVNSIVPMEKRDRLRSTSSTSTFDWQSSPHDCPSQRLFSAFMDHHSNQLDPLSGSSPKMSTPCFDPDQPRLIETEVGREARIPCLVHNVDYSSVVMSWWKENSFRELSVGNKVSSSRYQIDNRSTDKSWTLIIKNVTQGDSGLYICQINLAKIKEKFFQLTVTAPDHRTRFNDAEYVKDEAVGRTETRKQVVWIEGSTRGLVGRPHSLKCLATTTSDGRESHRPSPNQRRFTLSWTHNGHPLDLSYSSIVRGGYRWVNWSTLAHQLTWQRLDHRSAGQWTCLRRGKSGADLEMSSSSPSVDASVTVTLEVVDRFGESIVKNSSSFTDTIHHSSDLFDVSKEGTESSSSSSFNTIVYSPTLIITLLMLLNLIF